MCAKLRRCVSLHRFGAFLSALSFCFALSVPALADEVLASSFNLYFCDTHTSGFSDSFSQSVPSGTTSFSFLFPNSSSGVSWSLLSLDSSDITATGSVGVYLSFFYYSISTGANQSKSPSASDFSLYTYDVGGSQHVGSVSISKFWPSSSFVSMSDGVSVVGRINGSAGSPLRLGSLNLNNGGYSYSWGSNRFSFVPVSGDFPANDAGMRITSFRVVTSGSSEALDAIEDMASNIAAQNQILSQFYGDIVSVCNQIYSRLGDLQAAQEEANRLFSNVISLLNTTNGKIEAINMAMSTYFELLINQLKQEGIDTRTAIADAEARLELYLKPMIDYFNELEEQTGESAATLPGHKTDIDGFNNQGFGIDSDGQTGVAALVPILSAFGWIWSIIALFIGVGLIHILVKKGIG